MTLERIVDFFERLRPADLERLDEIYAPGAWFKDPFNEVEGTPAIRRIFEHMFATLDQPRFIVTEAVQRGDRAFLVWDFIFRLRGSGARELTVRGATHLVLDADDRILRHRDYWDAAEELYEKMPLLGPLMRWLKRRAGGTH